MASTYVNDLRLNEMATGDGSGTWGTTTNTNLELIAEAFSYGTEAITTNADTHATTIADGATDPGRSMYLKYTGTLDSACTITIGPNTVSKVWIIENGTSGSQNIIISQGSGADITIPAGDTKVVYSDGAGAGAAFFDAFASLSVVDLTATGTVTTLTNFNSTTGNDLRLNAGSANRDIFMQVNGATYMTVQGSTGNVGIGTSSPLGDLSIGINGNASGGNIQLGVDTNNANKYTAIASKAYASDAQPEGFITLASQAYDGGNETFIGGGLGELDASTGVRFYTAATTNTATGTERMRIDASGRVGIGRTPAIANAKLEVGGADNVPLINVEASGVTGGMGIGSTGLQIFHGSTAHMRIDSSGNLLVGASSGSKHIISKSVASGGVLEIINTSDTVPAVTAFKFTGAAPNDGTSTFFTTSDTSAYRGGWLSNGGVQNYQGNNSNLSDEREKKNIEDLSSTWDCVKSWNLRKFHYNEDEDSDDKRLGVIAQEVEAECPEVITEWQKQAAADEVLWTEEDELPEGVSVGDVKTAAQEEIMRKGVKEQQLYWMAIKALQEAMTEIETLKTKVETLENA
jgi:hypothetical protein